MTKSILKNPEHFFNEEKMLQSIKDDYYEYAAEKTGLSKEVLKQAYDVLGTSSEEKNTNTSELKKEVNEEEILKLINKGGKNIF